MGFAVLLSVAVVFMAAVVVCVFDVVLSMVVFVTVSTWVVIWLSGDTVVFFTAGVTVSIAWVVAWPDAAVFAAVEVTAVEDVWPYALLIFAPAWAVI